MYISKCVYVKAQQSKYLLSLGPDMPLFLSSIRSSRDFDVACRSSMTWIGSNHTDSNLCVPWVGRRTSDWVLIKSTNLISSKHILKHSFSFAQSYKNIYGSIFLFRSLVSSSYLLGKNWPLCSLFVVMFIVFLSLSWSLPSFLLECSIPI